MRLFFDTAIAMKEIEWIECWDAELGYSLSIFTIKFLHFNLVHKFLDWRKEMQKWTRVFSMEGRCIREHSFLNKIKFQSKDTIYSFWTSQIANLYSQKARKNGNKRKLEVLVNIQIYCNASIRNFYFSRDRIFQSSYCIHFQIILNPSYVL